MNGTTATLNKMLAPTGLELIRRGKSLSKLQGGSPRASAGRVLEIIGAQGVGKTTLVNVLQKSLRADWFFRSDLGQTGPLNSVAGPVEMLHSRIYFQRMQQLREKEANIWDITTLTRQMSRVIRESLTLLTNDFPSGFVLDEGLFKNFAQEVLELASESPDPLWNGRAFVHLRARNPEVVVARYQKRIDNRARRGLFQIPPTKAEIRKRIERENTLYDQICETALAFDVPVLILDAEGDQAQNIAKVLSFETSLRAMGPAQPK